LKNKTFGVKKKRKKKEASLTVRNFININPIVGKTSSYGAL
jgi:hypothetical protein